MAIEAETAQDNRSATPAGRCLDVRIKDLILDLTVPRAGERMLDIGCGSGNRLRLFWDRGCDVTGLDPSPLMLDQARQKIQHHADLRRGRAEDLPFSDNEFDIVTLITSLEFADDPGRAVAEAIRVCRGRVFIGAMNRCSLIGAQGRLPTLFPPPVSTSARFFHLPALFAMIRRQIREGQIRWGSVGFLPWDWYDFGTGLEKRIPVLHNPFGAFLGISFPVTFSFRTIQEAIRDPAAIGVENQRPMPGIIRELRQDGLSEKLPLSD